MTLNNTRLEEFAEFHDWPYEHVRELAKCSVAFFECVWRGLNPQTEDETRAYYDGPWLTLRQMAYPDKFCPNKKVRDVIDSMKAGQKLLDYGCGVGDSLIYAENCGVVAWGVEVPGKIPFLKYRRNRRNQNWTVVEPDWVLQREGFTAHRSVICGSLDHCDDPVDVARFLCRVTEGNILCTPRIGPEYDRPTHVNAILEKLPEAYAEIDAHNDGASD